MNKYDSQNSCQKGHLDMQPPAYIDYESNFLLFVSMTTHQSTYSLKF